MPKNSFFPAAQGYCWPPARFFNTADLFQALYGFVLQLQEAYASTGQIVPIQVESAEYVEYVEL
jgi:hypothetical protein